MIKFDSKQHSTFSTYHSYFYISVILYFFRLLILLASQDLKELNIDFYWKMYAGVKGLL